MDNRVVDGKKTMNSIVLNLVSSVITILVTFLIIPILTNIMSTADVGIATSFVTLKNILAIIVLLSIEKSIDRIILDSKDRDYESLSSILIISTISSLLFYFVYLLFSKFINNILGFSTPMMTLMFALVTIINGTNIYITYCNYKNKYKITFIYNILSSPIAQIMSLVLVYLLTTHKYLGRIIGLDFFPIIMGIIFSILILYRGKCCYDKKIVASALAISIPLIPHMLSQVLLSNCDLLMIKNMVGASEAGIYSIAYTLSNILYLIMLQLQRPWSPWVYRRIKNNEIDSINKNSSLLITFAALLAVGLFTVAPDAITLFLNSNYLPARYIVAPICVGIFFQIMYILFYDIEYYYKKNKSIAVFSIITAIINLILNYIFIKTYGYYAAAYTTLVSYLILTILHYCGVKKVENRKLYNIKYFVGLSIVVILLSLINVQFVDNIIIRYSLLFIFGIFVLIFKGKDLLSFLESFIKTIRK